MKNKKILISTFILCIVFSGRSYCQEKNYQYSDTVLFTRFDVGIGIGYDYGGTAGVKCMFYPIKNIQLFGSLAYLYSTSNAKGYSFGGKFFLPFKAKNTFAFAPYLLGIYGTNAQIIVSNATFLNNSFNGFSAGFGIDLHPAQLRNGMKLIRNSAFFKRFYASYTVIVPFRNQSVSNYRNFLKTTYNIATTSPLPITGSIGLHYKLF